MTLKDVHDRLWELVKEYSEKSERFTNENYHSEAAVLWDVQTDLLFLLDDFLLDDMKDQDII